ncbi:hypothetical protein CKM354_001204400 [Cercospora kikuchii]|uniref:6-methylsalicylate decarboxylase n=1 Tax=Cercospora kikuchii TaxID=84275 RepID=A0A9P3D123_9PEZI|nr:uncharacterized protein CKM354_001204400 [Cercospora kikuchii]GIZ49003.1 hypothetical protein CKM354_001204400 [Cercospora kikuchii]
MRVSTLSLLPTMAAGQLLNQVPEWILSKMFPWPGQPQVDKIDTHHHWVPAEYAEVVAAAGGDPSGWPTPQWSLEASQALMSRAGIKTSILSITAPGACIVEGKRSWDLARTLNVKAAAIRDSNPQAFGFFLSLGNIEDTAAALAEISYAFDTLKADGVCLFSRYGSNTTYLGHPSLEPIWAELNRRKAVVFVHPTHPRDLGRANAQLPQPVVDYPHETTRTAMDMLFSGTRRKFPNCSVILSHGGGTLPYLISRVATPLSVVNSTVSNATTGLTYEQIMQDFRSFHFDLALSAAPAVVRSLMETGVPSGNILYGSDFPYAPAPAYPAFLKQWNTIEVSSEFREQVHFRNALELFPRLKENGGGTNMSTGACNL